MALVLGLVGKPNVGKSTFFNAATAAHAEIANYPFTTINANKGVTYVATKDPGPALGVTSTPNNSKVEGDVRYVPMELIDVAGLVPGAHEGRGLGNKFLDDLRQAAALIHVVDVSGSTDSEGNPVAPGAHDPITDRDFLENELDHWIAGILGDGWERTARQLQALGGKGMTQAIAERLTGLGVKETHAHAALMTTGVDQAHPQQWTADDRFRIAKEVRKRAKPILIAGNKADVAKPEDVARLAAACAERDLLFVPCSAEAELALKNAAAHNVVQYKQGDPTFEVTAADKLNAKQNQALDYIRTHVLDRHKSTGIIETVRTAAYRLLDLIVCYPVENEHKYTDKQGRVLPDAFLIPQGTTAKEFAYKVHSDLGDHFIRAIDAKAHRVIGADHALKDGDIVRIVAGA